MTESNILDLNETDRRIIERALHLAARGAGRVSPGPLVGCVIAKDGEIVGEGFYVYQYVKHAETIALEQAGPLARGATAYISLEPHAHRARTEPCTAALINAGIERVVASIEDPNPLVSGKGFDELRKAGLLVETGVLGEEASRLNEKYIHFMRSRRPFVHLKLACSLDGRIAAGDGHVCWITGPAARLRVHELRHEYDAILAGAGTITNDDPLLTDRSGLQRRRPLVRVVLDESLTISLDSKIARTARESPVIVFSSDNVAARSVRALEATGVEVVQVPGGGRDLGPLLSELGNRSLQSLLVEGGSAVAGSFVDQRLVDKITFFVAPLLIGGSCAPTAIGGQGARDISQATRLQDLQVSGLENDFEITGYPVNS